MKTINILGMNLPWFGDESKVDQPKQSPSAIHRTGNWGRAYAISFDGEKSYGEIGPVVSYTLDHAGLRYRSWDAYLTSEIARTVLDRFSMWVIDKGLKLQLQPATAVLLGENIQINTEQFNTVVESRFSVWAGSKMASFNGMHSLNELAKRAFKSANIGGDVLVILRYKSGKLMVQLIDGSHMGTPVGLANVATGNRVVNGVEIDGDGKHIAYHIKDRTAGIVRIEAWSKSTGLRMAFMVYGSEYRMDDVRGVPIISTSLETLAKIERYKEAAVGSAEERQKIAFAIEHNQFSSGENPMANQLANLFDADGSDNGSAIPIDEQGQALAKTVSATTNKQAFNLPIGSKLMQLESKNEMFFKEFYETNANIICSALGIPPNVAFSIYNDSFSASRAATKDWEHTMEVKRSEFQSQFYVPILAMWLHTQILDFKIQAPGYINAFMSKNWMVIESYQRARFTGPMFPHVDPLKEAKAERVKLGTMADHIPLTNIERSTEILNGGDSESNIEQFGKEIELAKKNNIVPPEKKSESGHD
jgi:capsid protein